VNKILSVDDFKAIDIDDKKYFDEIYKKYPPVHSDNVFTTLVSWMEYADYHYTIIDKSLIIYSKINGQIRFRPPIGSLKKEVFDQVLNLAKNQEADYHIGMVTKETKEWMSENYPKIVFKNHRDYFDYVYLSKDLAELKGSSYSKIRNRLNKFKKAYIYSVEDISEENFDEVKKFLRRWCLWKDCESDPVLKYEKKAVLFSISNFFKLGLKGLIIRIDDKIESMAVFEGINDNTALVHYEKASPDFVGIYKAINFETANILQKDFKFINRESDMGISGLRKAKLSYRPYHMVEVYHADIKDLIIS